MLTDELDFSLPASVETWSVGRLRALAEMSIAFSRSLDPIRVFDTVVRRIQREMGGVVGLYIADGDTLHLQAGSGEDSDEYRQLVQRMRGHSIHVGQGVTGRAYATRTPVMADFRQACVDDPPPALPGIAVACAVPLLNRDGTAIGTFTVVRFEADAPAFTEADCEFLAAIAVPAALAVSNAHLHAETARLGNLVSNIIDMTPTAIAIWDEEFRPIKLNQALLQLVEGDPYMSVEEYMAQVSYTITDETGKKIEPHDMAAYVAWRDNTDVRQLWTFHYHDPVLPKKYAEVAARRLPEGYTVGVIHDITNETAARETAQQQAAQLHVILESISDGVFIYDTDARLTYMNTAAQTLLGITDKDAFMRLSLDERLKVLRNRTLDGAQRGLADSIILRVLRGEAAIHIDGLVTRLDTGEERVQRQSAAPIYSDGHITGVVLTFTDLTELHRQTDALQRANTEITQMFEALPISVARYSYPDFRYTRINRYSLEFLKGTHQDIIGSTAALEGYCTPEAWQRVNNLIRNNQPINISEFPIPTPDGGVSYWNMTFRGLKNDTPDAPIDAVLSASIDVTAEVEARQQIEAQKAQLAAFFQATPDAVIVVSRDGVMEMFNAAAAELLHVVAGMERKLPDQGGPYSVLDLAKQPLPVGARLRDRVLRGAIVHNEPLFILRHDDDSLREVRVNAAPVRFSDAIEPEYIVMSIRDVTEARQMEQQLLAQQTQVTVLTQANALKSEFVRIVSHELRTPLTGILGFAELLTMRVLPPETVFDYAKKLVMSAERMRAIIDEFLNVQRLEAGHEEFTLETVTVRELVTEALCATPAPTRKAFIVGSMEEVRVRADHKALLRVIENLVGNAAKYSPDSAPIHIMIFTKDGEAIIAVKDYGIGIPPADLPRIFEKFFRVRREGAHAATPGTGLGLAIAQQIVLHHGGRLWAESTGVAGEGSIFYVALPLVTD